MDPWSTSLAVAEQLRLVPTTTPLEGEIAAAEMVGAVLITLTVAVADAADPLESVAVAVHLMVDPTFACDALTV